MLSIRSAGAAEQLNGMNCFSERLLNRCIAWATSSFPVPDSPAIRTVEFESLTLPMTLATSFIARLSKIIPGSVIFPTLGSEGLVTRGFPAETRSEERRVGKEGRAMRVVWRYE